MIRTRLIPASLCLALGFSATAHADLLGLRLGAYQWHPDIEGTVRDGHTRVDLEDDLGFDDDRYNTFYIALEHPVPLLPNVRLARSDMDASAHGQLTRAFDFDGEIYLPGQSVRSQLDLSHTDLTLYYELLDNVVSLDAGLTVRRFDEGISIQSSTASASLDLDETLPMLYLAARVDLPFSGLYAGADINAISYSDNDLADYRIHLGYVTDLGLGLELGLRSFDLNYDDGDEEADLKMSGAYGSLLFRF